MLPNPVKSFGSNSVTPNVAGRPCSARKTFTGVKERTSPSSSRRILLRYPFVVVGFRHQRPAADLTVDQPTIAVVVQIEFDGLATFHPAQDRQSTRLNS